MHVCINHDTSEYISHVMCLKTSTCSFLFRSGRFLEDHPACELFNLLIPLLNAQLLVHAENRYLTTGAQKTERKTGMTCFFLDPGLSSSQAWLITICQEPT